MREQFAQHVSAVGALGEALDGTPTKQKRAAKRANPNSEVTTNVVCYCGSRFGDLVDFSTHVRGGCPELVRVSELRDRIGRRRVAACGTLGGYGSHWNKGEPVCDSCAAVAREWRSNYQTTDEYRKKNRERERRKRTDPDYRARGAEYQRGLRANPETREKINARRRELHARKKAERDHVTTEAAGMPQPDSATTNQLEGVCP